MTGYCPKRWLSSSRLSSQSEAEREASVRGWVHQLAPLAQAGDRAKLLGNGRDRR